MSLMHNFKTWHNLVGELTSKAVCSRTAKYYMLYSQPAGGGRKLGYFLFDSQEQLSAAMVESLDTETEIYRVGEVNQLTGKRMFIWPDALPKEVVWAVVHKSKRQDFGTGQEINNLASSPSPLPQLSFYEWDKIHLARGIHTPIETTFSGRPKRQVNLKDSLVLEAAYSQDINPRTQNGITQFVVNHMLFYGEFEHRWFGHVDIVQIKKELAKNNAHYESCFLHNVLLGDREFS